MSSRTVANSNSTTCPIGSSNPPGAGLSGDSGIAFAITEQNLAGFYLVWISLDGTSLEFSNTVEANVPIYSVNTPSGLEYSVTATTWPLWNQPSS